MAAVAHDDGGAALHAWAVWRSLHDMVPLLCTSAPISVSGVPRAAPPPSQHTFDRASAFNQAVGEWDVSGVTSLRGTFWRASAFNQPVTAWDVSSVTDMSAMAA